MNYTLILSTFAVLFSLSNNVQAFSPSLTVVPSLGISSVQKHQRSSFSASIATSTATTLFSSPEGSPEGEKEETEDSPDVPINLPSPVLLSSSMVLAIASTGSIFEIVAGNGSIPSLAIAILGVPTCFFLFYAAIRKGIAETEEDDAAYNRKINRF